MTTIYLIRHAEAEGNLYRVAQGQRDSGLTSRGWRQVRALERRFAAVPVDAVYASDLYRARATASAICKPKGLPLLRREGLREIHVGDWEGRTWGEIARKWPEAMADFSERMDRWSIPGAETPAETLARVLAALEDIVRENPGRTVAAVSHGYAIRLVLARLQGVSLRDTGARSPTGDNTAVSLLEGDETGLRVVWRDDNSHLKTPEYLAGEKEVRRRDSALEPGLWFQEWEWPGIRDRLPVWREWGARPSGSVSLTLEGFRVEEPAGLIQLSPLTGRISLVYVRPEFRRRGFGAQFIGQAVLYTRDRGGEELSAALAPDDPAREFFLDCGFLPQEGGMRAPKGREPLVRSVGLGPDIC